MRSFAFRDRLYQFWRDESASMTVFSLFLLICMLIVGGMGVDMIRHETQRVRLQSALDRCTLAAADLEQTVNPEIVVRDCFRRSGVSQELKTVNVARSMNASMVNVSAEVIVPTFFMRLAGVTEISAAASARAEEAKSDVEIVLVLDVSGSMGEASGASTKIALLRTAAQNFVSTVRANDSENRVSIAVVPFNAQVNLGPTLFNALVADGYNITDRHGIANSFCLDLQATDVNQTAIFGTPTLPRGLALPQAGLFDSRSSTTRNTSYINPQGVSTGNIFCRTDTRNFASAPAQDVTSLRTQMQGLQAEGNTSITLGMEWGLFLLDPETRPLFDRMITSGQMPANLSGRPYNWDRENTMKVIVVMTDGEHVASDFLLPGWRSGASPIFRATDNRYSIRHSSGHPVGYPFWVPHLGEWHWRAWNGTTPPAIPSTCADNDDDDNDDGVPECVRVASPMTAMTWPQVWQNLRMSWVAWQLYARALGTSDSTRTSIYNAMMDGFTNSTTVATMNSTLQQTCQQARARGVVVYGIAFEAPLNGQTQIRNCASSPAHAFNATGLEIGVVFQSIAAKISQLRLTQ